VSVSTAKAAKVRIVVRFIGSSITCNGNMAANSPRRKSERPRTLPRTRQDLEKKQGSFTIEPRKPPGHAIDWLPP
jgi:hypothetical protein